MSTLIQVVKHIFSSGGTLDKSAWTANMGSFYDMKATDIDGKEGTLKPYAGNVALVVNVACLWGSTKSAYQAMVRLYAKYKDQGFTVLAFPANDFGKQEPWDEKKIKEFVEKEFKVSFPMFSKIHVTGSEVHPIYQFLLKCFPGDITWNFATKFLVNRQGVPVRRFNKGASWEDIEKEIVELLKEQAPSAQAEQKVEQKASEAKAASGPS